MEQLPAEQNHILAITSQFIKKEPLGQMSFVEKEELFLFFSVDICNSTRLKAQEKNWLNANRLLYEESFSPMNLWKFIGDEAVYAVPLENINDLPSLIERAHHYLKQLQNELCEQYGPSFRLKGTIWMAETGNGTAGYHIKSLNMINEFLGVDIDEGFRLSKNITGSKIVLDSKVVYALLAVDAIYRNEYDGDWFDENSSFYKKARNVRMLVHKQFSDLLSSVKFLGYTKLKGIWNGRPYPVFWYGQEETDYDYDEEFNNTEVMPRKVEEKSISKLEKIFTVVGVKNTLIRIFNGLAEGTYQNAYTLDSSASLYYSVACVNPQSGRVLIARRSETRKHLKGVWEFLPYKHTSTDIAQSIEKRFVDEFSLEIHIVTDDETEKNVLPLHFCKTYRYGRVHNNLLCVAYFDEGQSDDEILSALRKNVSPQKHSDYAFIDAEMCRYYQALSSDEINKDSIDAMQGNSKVFDRNKATMYFEKTVQAVEAFVRRDKEGRKWFHD